MKIKLPIELEFIKNKYNSANNYQVKLGGFKDGGYVTDYRSVLRSKLLISGGVGSNVRFESDFHDINNKLKVILIDPTVSIVRMFLRACFHFIKKNESGFRSLSEVFNYLYFIKKSRLIKKYLNNDFNIENLLENYNELNTVFLKLDIEGFEYSILESILKYKKYFTGLCIEFHSLNIPENCSKLESFLIELDFEILNISVNEVCLTDNNYPSVLEISFIPKSVANWPLDFNEAYYLQNSNALNNEMIVLEI